MSSEQEKIDALVRERVEAIVQADEDVRGQVAGLIADTAAQFHLAGRGLVGLSRSVIDGTKEAMQKSMPTAPDSVLRQVVDGLGDGFSAAAQATQLAVGEARSKGEEFAAVDLTAAAEDLGTLGGMFVETVGKTLEGAEAQLAGQAQELQVHAERTVTRIRPSIESALSTATQDPGKLAGEVVEVSRRAAGELFGAIGKLMQQAGKRMSDGEGSS